MHIPDKHLSRKFIVTMFVLLSITVGVALDWIPPDVYSKIVIACLSVYGLANVAQKALLGSKGGSSEQEG